MNCLPSLTPTDAEVTIEKLDKVAKSLSARILSFAKLFGILFGWCIFNLIISMFIDRTRSLSLDAYRMVAESIRNLAPQDVFFILSLFFDDKLSCFITIAIFIAFGLSFLVSFLNFGGICKNGVCSNRCVQREQSGYQNAVYVVSYKQQVAFLA